MHPISWLDIIVLSIVEGVTEFLPISSTGHMIITQNLMGIEKTPELEAFLVIVQGGAILAVMTLFLSTFRNWATAWLAPARIEDAKKHRMESIYIALAVVPFGAVGFVLRHHIKELFSIQVVAAALIVGGILILVAEKLLVKKGEKNFSDLTLKDAIIIGCGQCLALWPGFSRSASTIIFSRFLGYSRTSAAKVSFIIGVPTLFGAASYEAVKEFQVLNGIWFSYLAVGIVIAWVVAYLCAKWFIQFLQRFSMASFAIYRIVVGILLHFYFNA